MFEPLMNILHEAGPDPAQEWWGQMVRWIFDEYGPV